ncbi:hypothetical protein CPAV1605_19 [seawater metagenome]|uniref:Uncharacterized protein n=1 Tax=seawater metagenome TaxID=1561972 RepID=A0A5E8CI43_9ZZZZ
MNYFWLIPLVILISNTQQKRKCVLIPEESIELKGYEHYNIKNLFLKAIGEYKKNGVEVEISQYDLFHCHHCSNNTIVFHAKEHPNHKAWPLGYCQIGSKLSLKNFDKRNLVYCLKTDTFKILPHTPGLLFLDCKKILIEYFIDPNTHKTYKLLFNK